MLNGAVGFGAAAVWALGAGDLAAPFRGAALGLIAAGHGDVPGSSRHLAVAWMSVLLADWPAADDAFAQARSHLDGSGQRPLRAMVDLDDAIARSRRRGSDPVVIARLAASAAEGFDALGMDRWAGRARALVAATVPVAPAARQPIPAGLTTREVEVVRLVVRGLSDRQIGEMLFVSPRTVHTHLRNLLAKTGLANRTELSVWAVEHGVSRR